MTRNDYWITMSLVIVFSLIGGSVTTLLTRSSFVFAQDQDEPSNIIEAREFRLVSEDGSVVAKFSSHNAGHFSLDLVDSNGVSQASLSLEQGGYIKAEGENPRLDLVGRSGNLIWSLPPETKHMFVR